MIDDAKIRRREVRGCHFFDPRLANKAAGHGRKSYSSSRSPSPERRKSFVEQAMAAAGIGGLAAAAGGGHDRSRSRDRKSRRSRRYSSDSSSSSRSRTRGRGRAQSVNQQQKIQQAAKAALIAGATEAFRARKEPGGWKGDKGKRVLTAAIGAGGIDGLVSSDKNPEKHDTMHTIQAVIGGLAGNRLINGARSKSRDRGDRGRHGDSGGGGGMLEKILGAGAAAAGGKALLDRARSKSRGRRGDSDSDDSRDARRPKRSKSVSDYARQGMGLLGMGGDKGGDKKESRGSRRGYDDDDDYYSRRKPPPREARLRGGGGEGGEGLIESSRSRSHSSSGSNSNSDSNSDTDTEEEEKECKKMRGKEYLTAGLASVATIHAAHNVYQSVHQRNERHKMVANGTMSPGEAKKKKTKNRLQDAASIGIAAIGIKGAIGEWKEMKEHRHEYHEVVKKREEKREKRLKKLEDRMEERNRPSPIRSSHARPLPYSNSTQAGQANYSQAVYPSSPWNGPHYADGNPYSAEGLPLPPMGPPQQRY